MAYVSLMLICLISLCVKVHLKCFELICKLGKEKSVFSNVLEVLTTSTVEEVVPLPFKTLGI